MSCGHPELTGHQQSLFSAKIEQLVPQIAPALGAVGWPGLQASFLWEEAPETSLCGNSYSLALSQVQTPTWRILLKASQTPGCDSIRAGSVTCQILQAAQYFFPAPKSSGKGAACAVSPQGRFSMALVAFGLVPRAPPCATSPHNSGLGCAI